MSSPSDLSSEKFFFQNFLPQTKNINKWNRTIETTNILMVYLLSGPTSSGTELSLSPLLGRWSLPRDGDSTTSSGILTSDALVGRPFVVVPLSVTTDASERGDCISVPTRDECFLRNSKLWAIFSPFFLPVRISLFQVRFSVMYPNWAFFMTTPSLLSHFFSIQIPVRYKACTLCHRRYLTSCIKSKASETKI